MTRVCALGVLVGAAACAASTDPRERAVLIEPPGSAPAPSAPTGSSGSATSEPLRALPSIPIEKIGLDAIACVQRPPSVALVNGKKKLSLCDASLEHCFLEARTSAVQGSGMILSIERAKSPRWMLEARVEGVALRGFVDTLQQAPARTLVMNGFYIPRVLEVVEGIQDGLRVTTKIASFVAPSAPLQADIRCDDLATAHRRELTSEAIAEVTKTMGKAEERELDPTTLFDGDGNKVAELSAPPHTLVDAFHIKRGRRFIQLELGDGVAFGWVSISALHKPTVGAGMGFGTGSGRLPAPRPLEAGQRCDHDLPVIAFFNDRRFEVGTVPAGTWFTATMPIDSDHRELDLYRPRGANDTRENATWKPPRGVKLGVPSASLRRCETR